MSILRNLRLSPALKRIFVSSVGGGFGLLSIGIGVGMYIVETLTHPKKSTLFAEYTFSPFELGLPAEEVSFAPLYGEHKVSGWYVPAAEATTTIILSPGYREGRSDMLGMGAMLWRAGYNVLLFEYYGHGTVVGKSVTLGYREINDFLGAVIYAKQHAPQTRLGAVGYSMGAAVSIMGCARTTEVEALVADSAFATHRSVIDYAVRRQLHLPFALFDWITDGILWLRAGYRLHQVEPLRDIGRLAPRPILIIHGLKDSIVDPRDAPLLFAAAGEPKELWLLPGVDHCGAYFADRVAYTKRVIDFFDRTLRNMPSQPQNVEPASEQLSEAS
jgi:uncharacterized protein